MAEKLTEQAEPLSEQEWGEIRRIQEHGFRPDLLAPYDFRLLLRALAEVQAERDALKKQKKVGDDLIEAALTRAEQAEAALAKVEKERDDATESEAVLARAIVSLQTALATERAQRGAMREAAQRVYDDVFINIVDTDQHFANWEALRAALAAQPPAPSGPSPIC